jgi:hypothetical protein
VLRQREFHISLRLLEAGRLHNNGWLFTTAIPTVIAKPKLAFDTQAGRYLQAYRMLCHHSPPECSHAGMGMCFGSRRFKDPKNCLDRPDSAIILLMFIYCHV